MQTLQIKVRRDKCWSGVHAENSGCTVGRLFMLAEGTLAEHCPVSLRAGLQSPLMPMVAGDAQPLYPLAPVSTAGVGRGGGSWQLCPALAGLPSTPPASSEGLFFPPPVLLFQIGGFEAILVLCLFLLPTSSRPCLTSWQTQPQLQNCPRCLTYISLPCCSLWPGPSWSCRDFSPALQGVCSEALLLSSPPSPPSLGPSPH